MGTISYGTYLEQRDKLIRVLVEQVAQFDKYVLTLASGTFGLSLLFIRQIAPNLETSTIPLLTSAWIGFCLTIVTTLISFLLSQLAISKQLQILDLWYKKEADLTEEEIKNKLATCTKVFNWFSMFLFLLGVGFLAAFGILNLLS